MPPQRCKGLDEEDSDDDVVISTPALGPDVAHAGRGIHPRSSPLTLHDSAGDVVGHVCSSYIDRAAPARQRGATGALYPSTVYGTKGGDVHTRGSDVALGGGSPHTPYASSVSLSATERVAAHGIRRCRGRVEYIVSATVGSI